MNFIKWLMGGLPNWKPKQKGHSIFVEWAMSRYREDIEYLEKQNKKTIEPS